MRTKESKTNKNDLIEYEILNLPIWSSDYQEFWCQCFESERKNSVLYRHIIIPLPTGISLEKIKPAVYGFVHYMSNKHFNSKIPLMWALHSGVKQDYKHIHILLHDRPIDTKLNKEEHFTTKNPKVKGINALSSSFLDEIKQCWINFINPLLADSDKFQLQSKAKKYSTDPVEIRTSSNFVNYSQPSLEQTNYKNSYEFMMSDEFKLSFLNGIRINFDAILRDGLNISHNTKQTQELENSNSIRH
ncbi:MobA/MobL family protein [Thiomicrorhabdus aquaedulcis]|uniref:MobA/MobL family protein n=1 Tax=Thiomicrorhabdus aquaedulcis TaxID=2211106 RepID=UPI001562804F|nr:MobA/MobL family protein [Thiomicrorhabdus aquaedulcis]